MCVGKNRNANRVRVRESERKNYSEDLDLNGWVILKWI